MNKRKNKSHLQDLKNNKFENIDLVIVNFYQFEKTLEQTKNHDKIIENIDIGGPTLIRAAAKNYNDVTVITSTNQYSELINELRKNSGGTSLNFRKRMSQSAFAETAYFAKQQIMQDSAAAILAQANMNQGGLMQLVNT